RADRVPDLAPHLTPGHAEGRVLVAQQRHVSVVVKEAQLRTPPHDHGEPRGEADAAGGAQAGGPVTRIAEGGLCPRVAAHPPRHLPVPREDQALPPATSHEPKSTTEAASQTAIANPRRPARDVGGAQGHGPRAGAVLPAR